MRGLSRLAAAPGLPATSASASAAYSTFSGGGGGGGGRGGGRGSSPPPRPPLPPQAPGQAEPDADEEPFAPTGLGHGRGRPVLPSSPVLPPFSSWMSSFKPSSSPAAGRGCGPSPPPPESVGRGLPQPPPASADDSQTKRPIFFKMEDFSAPPAQTQFSDPEDVTPLPWSLSPLLSSSGRGKPSRSVEPDSRASEENRHIRPRAPIGAPRGGRGLAEPRAGQPTLNREEAVRKAVEVLSRGGAGGGRGGGRGRGGRGVAMRGRGRGGRFRGRRTDDAAGDFGLYLGDNADGERLEKRLGEENMKKLAEEFEEMSWSALPSPLEDAYWDAVHTNNMV